LACGKPNFNKLIPLFLLLYFESWT
jgi:hypothetical protein